MGLGLEESCANPRLGEFTARRYNIICLACSWVGKGGRGISTVRVRGETLCSGTSLAGTLTVTVSFDGLSFASGCTELGV